MTDFNANEHMMILKGREYLPVKWRVVWFREDHPDGTIVTEMIEHDLEKQYALFRATINIPAGGSSTGYGSESIRDFSDYIEKAETKAIGRALATLGYGTQFAPELDEGERIVDSPVERPQTESKTAVKQSIGTEQPATSNQKDQIKRLYRTAKGKEIDPKELTSLSAAEANERIKLLERVVGSQQHH